MSIKQDLAELLEEYDIEYNEELIERILVLFGVINDNGNIDFVKMFPKFKIKK